MSTNKLDEKMSRKLSPQELEGLASVPKMKNLFHKSKVDFFGSSNHSNGILYLSRFVTKVHARAVSMRPTSGVDNTFNEIKHIADKVADTSSVKVTPQEKLIKRRYAMSLATLASKPSKRNDIVANGGISVLVDFSLTPDDDIVSMSCAATFVFLSKEEELRHKLTDEKCLSALNTLMQNNNAEIKKDCCRAFCNIALVAGSAKTVAREGIAQAIVPLVKRNQDIMDVCLRLLLNLTCADEKYLRIEEVMLALFELYSLYYRMEDKELLIMQAVCNLSSIRGNHYSMAEEGVRAVLDRAMKSTVKRCQVIAAETLKNLSTCPRTRTKLVDYNIMDLLVTMLKNDNNEVRIHCLNAFVNFAADSTCVFKVANTSVMAAVVFMCLTSTSVDVCKTLARVFKILCENATLGARLTESNGIRALEHISSQASSNAAAVHFCVESLRLLYGHVEDVPVLHIGMKEQGALTLLVHLSNNCAMEVTKVRCAFTLHFLISKHLCTAEDMSTLILPCLIALYSRKWPDVNAYLAATLSLISQNLSVDAGDAIPVLVSMLTSDPEEGTRRSTAAALSNLSHDPKNCQSMLEVGALIPVVQLTQAEDTVTKVTCASIISTLSSFSRFSAQFRHAAVLSVLLRLSRVDHTPTQRRIVVALSNLSQTAELRTLLLDQQPIPFLNSLASKPDESIRRGCAAVICNLSYDVGTEAAFARADIVSCLLIIALVASDKVESKITCVKALINLMADANLMPGMIKDGIIWGLGSLALVGSDEMLELCAGALTNIAYHHPRDVIASPIVEKVVTALLKHDELLFLQRGATLLYCLTPNVDVYNTDDEKLCNCFLLNCEKLIQSRDVDICNKFLTSLCFTSQLIPCRTLILEAESHMLVNLQFDLIGQDPTISYTYLSTLLNVSRSCRDLSKLLNDEAMKLLLKIASFEGDDAAMGISILKILYTLTCFDGNIVFLDHPLLFPLVELIVKANPGKESTDLAVSFLYNLSTCERLQQKFVAMGIVHLLLQLWPNAQTTVANSELTVLALCHLACGKVNTSRMIEDGCAPMLVFVTTSPIGEKFKKLTFERCASAWRNLFCNMAGQVQLVEAGAMGSVIAIAEKAQQKHLSEAMRHNCTSTLRSITFNPDLREILTKTPAVDIILNDLGEGVLPSAGASSTKNLLRDLETESWVNGSRGCEKEGKAPYMSCGPLHTLHSNTQSNDAPDIEIPLLALEKYLVQVTMDASAEESEIELTKEASVFKPLEVRTIYDADDANQLHLQPFPKQSCEESENPLYFLRFGIKGVIEEDEVIKTPPRLTGQQRRASRRSLLFLPQDGRNSQSLPILGSALEETNVTSETKRLVKTGSSISRHTKKMDDLIKTIKKSKNPDANVSTEEILSKFAEVKKF